MKKFRTDGTNFVMDRLAADREAGNGWRTPVGADDKIRTAGTAGQSTVKNMKPNTVADGAKPRGKAADPLGVNSEIGRKLKQYYDDLVSDDVPDRFAQLLAQLEKSEPSEKKD